MEAHVLLAWIGAAAAFCCGASAVVAIGLGTRRRGASAKAVDAASAGRASWRLRRGVGWARPAARAALRIRPVAGLAHEAATALGARGYATTPEALLSVAVAVLAFAMLASSLVSSSIACGFAVGICVCACSIVWLRAAQDRRREALREAVPDALRSMSVCFQSGLSLMQTLQQTAAETKEPLSTLFEQAAHRLEVGGGADEALSVLRGSASVPELAFAAVALDVQHQAGGSMKRVLDAARDSVESQNELRRSLRVQTAQAKLSARVVSVMPFVLIALFSLVSEGFLEPFFQSALGLAVLGLALGMQAAGIAMVRRMLKVEVA